MHRVTSASVCVEDEVSGEIGPGILVFLGVWCYLVMSKCELLVVGSVASGDRLVFSR
ncbi:hypothetical protein ACQWKP_23070 [Salmonella enterica subsp. enterica serovar Infantis]